MSPVRSCKILVVEDFDRFRQSVVLSLRQRAEFQLIYEASDGLEAVERAEELKPDLILLDIGLPHVNGIEAARRIRKVSPNSKILMAGKCLTRTERDILISRLWKRTVPLAPLRASPRQTLLFYDGKTLA